MGKMVCLAGRFIGVVFSRGRDIPLASALSSQNEGDTDQVPRMVPAENQ